MLLRILFAGLLSVLIAQPAAAGFVVSVSNANIAAGSTGFVDISIVADSDGPHTLNLFSIEVLITQISGAATSQLAFGPITDAQYSNPTYVYFGNSLNVETSQPSGNIGTSNWFNDTYVGGDAALAGDGTVIGSTSFLLVRLDLTTVLGGNSPVGGEVFDVSVRSTGNTTFLDPDFASVAYSTNSGRVSVYSTDVNPVPAPPGMILAASAFGTLVLFRRRLSRQKF